MERAALFDAMGTLFDVAPIRRRFGEAAMPRLLHAAAAVTLAGGFVPFHDLVRTQLGAGALDLFAELDPFPDVEPALAALGGARAAILTNASEDVIVALLHRAGLEHLVDLVVAADDARAYKPHPAPYRLALSRLGLSGDRVTFVAAYAWDVVGAGGAGLVPLWLNRSAAAWPYPFEEPAQAGSLVEAAARAAV